ncbi:TfuA-like protein [Cognatishimia sp. F0-27]|uniref:TfuA-like protein n=1 Tax=Cognatishimia sp. F0-27 TaxID=2816855 RepID=UPI001D0CD997|nr:TfuA-like protein [Cognatishimia sp. F0-27]MCC1491918.1 TfuA-like protein [Cognatishimia sp. F0-27]
MTTPAGAGRRTRKPVVFLGPSLPVAEARKILDAEYRPPAGQGDLYRASLDRPPALALIDGIFKDAPTVRHREILWALGAGIPVFGAASMGALRAAELDAHGMIGIGVIFRWYRRFALLPDDAVAVTHMPAELGAQPLSDALVDIQRSLSRARRSGALDNRAAAAMLRACANLPFPERRLPAEAAPFRVPQKAADARALLTRLAALAEADTWPRPDCPEPPLVHAWLDDLHDSGLPLPQRGAP